MSARRGPRSVVLACLGTLSGATAVLASTGTIHLTATREQSPNSSLADVLGSLSGSVDTAASSASPSAAVTDAGAPNPATAQPTAAGRPTATPSQTHEANPTPTRQHGVSGTFTGDVSRRNFYGPVQVQITVSNGKITDARLIQMPPQALSISISEQAAVYLREEVLSSQSASISWIGGASLTSPAYIESLSSAIARAGI